MFLRCSLILPRERSQLVVVRFDARDDASRRLAERLRAADRREAADQVLEFL
jgi:hypothetical protein